MDELLGRQMPHSLEAEQAVLGSILIDSRCVAEVIGALRPEDFYQEQNRVIFETIYSMFNFSQVIDPVTVLDKLKERGVYDEKTSVPYIMQLMEITPTAANVMQYAEIVRDKALLRNVATAASEITQTVYDGVGTAQDILEAAEKAVAAVDDCVDKVLKKILEMGGGALLTADHGNADKMIAEDGSPFTAHTTNPVPVVLVCDALKGAKLREGGVLADLAPTLLDMMGLPVPAEMTGKTLIVR